MTTFVVISDLRHSFERRKRRKLTKEEKRMFRNMAEKFISEKFGGATDKTEENKIADKKDEQKRAKGVPNIVTKTSSIPNQVNILATTNQSNSNENNKAKTSVAPSQVNSPIVANQNNLSGKSKARVNEERENSIEMNIQKVIVPGKSHQPVKRKLEETEPTTPVTKLRKTDTILQKLKSPDNIKPFTERTNIEPVRNKTDIPFNARKDNTTPRGAFQYKGIRGGEDLDLTQTQNMKSDADKKDNLGKSENVLFSPTCGRSPVNEAINSILSSDDSLPDIHFVSEQIEIETVNDENVESVGGRGNGSRGRRARGGRARGRGGRGRGNRGARGNSSSFWNDQSLLDELEEMRVSMNAVARDLGFINGDSDASILEEPRRGRGRGRGRGSGRGRGRKKNETPR